MPSHNGKVTSKMHGDTFAILGGSQHPKEAFKVYTYMLSEGSADLYKIYGGLPARKSQQAEFFAGLDAKFAPVKANWQVALDSIPFMDVPNHELGTPNYAKTFDLFSRLGEEQIYAESRAAHVMAVAGRGKDGALALILVNRSAQEVSAPLVLTGHTVAGAAATWRLDRQHNSTRVTDTPLDAPLFLPAESVTLLIIP